MSHGILKQAAFGSAAIVLLLSGPLLTGTAAADTTPTSPPQSSSQACSTLDLASNADKQACQYGYSTYYKDGNQPAQAKVCTSSQFTAADTLDACNQGWDVASGNDPAEDSNCTKSNCDLIDKYINPAINLLSVMFGLIVVISLILGGIQFAASEGDPQKASQAKNRISNTILALFVYALFYGFIEFLVPGGLFAGKL